MSSMVECSPASNGLLWDWENPIIHGMNLFTEDATAYAFWLLEIFRLYPMKDEVRNLIELPRWNSGRLGHLQGEWELVPDACVRAIYKGALQGPPGFLSQ